MKLSIDDFGTGYSSLSYLRRFPVDALKIDRSFVGGLGVPPGGNPADEVLVSGIVGLAHALGLEVVAEGVENAEQLARLREMGCDMVQGYHFSGPLSAEAATEFLRAAAEGDRDDTGSNVVGGRRFRLRSSANPIPPNPGA